MDLRIIDAINAKYVYPSNALKILWDNLAENSILFELFVDDIWIENPVRKETDVGKKFIQFNLNNFNECMNYLDYLINVESDIRTFLRNRGSLERYFGFFGERPITQQLYDGLWNSYNAYFKDKSNDDQNIQIQLESQLKKLSNRIEAL